MSLDSFQLLAAVHVAHVVQWIADDRDVDAAALGGLEHVLDRRWMAAPEIATRQHRLMKLRRSIFVLVHGTQNMRMEIDNH